MPSTIESDFARVESIALSAAESGHVSSEGAEALRTYFTRLEKEVLAAYQADRNVASRIYDREEIAQFWYREMNWFAAQFEIVERFDRHLRKIGIHDPDLEPIRQNVQDAYLAASNHYHMHA